MCLPNFLIIGVPKAGTTMVYKCLAQHPDVFLPDLKEPRFFTHKDKTISDEDPVNQNTVTDLDEYRSLFRPVSSQTAIGEVSPGYFSDSQAPHLIRDILHSPKLLVVLRNPIKRAFSHFVFAKQKNFEPESATFEDVLKHKKVCVGNWTRSRSYVETGYYYKHLTRWRSLFGRDKVKILFFEDLKSDSISFIQSVYDILKINNSFKPDVRSRYAKSGLPKNKIVHRVLTKTGYLKNAFKKIFATRIVEAIRQLSEPLRTRLKNMNLEKPKLPNEIYLRLANKYEQDIRNLEDEVGRDLSHWLEPPKQNS